MSQNIRCSKCHEISQDPDFCSECGSPIGKKIVNLDMPSGKSSSTALSATVSRQGVSARVGGYGRGNNLLAPRATKTTTTHRTNNASSGSQSQQLSNGTGSHNTSGSRKHTSRSSSSRRKSLGGGLFQVPSIISMEPENQVLKDIRIPQSKMICSTVITPDIDPKRAGEVCGNNLAYDGKFCSVCGSAYSFKPALKKGDVVAGQYEIYGPMAFGGLGWIYLGMDVKLNRWVVLKGLLNTKDEDAAAAAVAERQFLAKVKHGRIVGIYNFVAHGAESYIVMEYVGGRTLKEIRKERGPLPVNEAISYILGIMPAFQYLHGEGLIYCDFKPDNFMFEQDDVKLIDLGGVRLIDDPNGNIYNTRGFAPPEMADDPSVLSDIYTIGRTLAVLIMDFDNTRQYQYSLPAPNELSYIIPNARFVELGFEGAVSCNTGISLPNWLQLTKNKDHWVFDGVAPDQVFNIKVTINVQGVDKDGNSKTEDLTVDLSLPLAENESLYRYILKATAEDPDLRFQTIEEMSDQLLGVFREIMAREKSIPIIESKEFGSEKDLQSVNLMSHRDMWKCLPDVKMNVEDPAISKIMVAMMMTDKMQQNIQLTKLCNEFPSSMEVIFSLLKVQINQNGEVNQFSSFADKAVQLDPFEWKIDWYYGLFFASKQMWDEAIDYLDRVYSEIPGETVPKLALAICLEGSQRYQEALNLYTRVFNTDKSLLSANFGIARCRFALGKREDSIETLTSISSNVSCFKNAMLMASHYLFDSSAKNPNLANLIDASNILEKLEKNSIPYYESVFLLALETLKQIKNHDIKEDNNTKIFNMKLTGKNMQTLAEKSMLSCARLTETTTEKYYYIDKANHIRPWTVM